MGLKGRNSGGGRERLGCHGQVALVQLFQVDDATMAAAVAYSYYYHR